MKEFSRKLEDERLNEGEDSETEDEELGIKFNFKEYFDFEDPFNEHMKEFDDLQFCNFVLSFILEAWRHNTWVSLKEIILLF